MGLIHLVRHGQASFGARDYDQLSSMGHRQATLLGQWLAQTGNQPQKLLRGSLTRHRQTAETCLAAWTSSSPCYMNEDAAFDEFDHRDILVQAHPEFSDPGYLEAFLTDQPDGRRAFQKVFTGSVARWMSSDADATSDTGAYKESWGSFRDRCVAGLTRATAQKNQGDTWIFTSGGPIAAIVGHVLGLSDDRILDLNWSILNASITTLRPAKGRFLLHQFNSIAHLQTVPNGGLVTYR